MTLGVSTCFGHSPQTRSLRSSDCTRSRSAAELLLSQKTELPCHHDGLLKEYLDSCKIYLGFAELSFLFFLYMLNAVCYIFIESNTWKERMSGLFRFGVSLDKALLDKFDRYIKERNYSNRSEAFRDLIRQELIKKEWLEGDDVAGAITLIYDHHRRDLLNKITDLQHDFQKVIISTQHIHLDHDNCLEIVAVRGQPREVSKLADMMKSIKGVKHCTLSMSSTGEHIE